MGSFFESIKLRPIVDVSTGTLSDVEPKPDIESDSSNGKYGIAQRSTRSEKSDLDEGSVINAVEDEHQALRYEAVNSMAENMADQLQ